MEPIDHVKITHTLLMQLFCYFRDEMTDDQDMFEIMDIIKEMSSEDDVLSSETFELITNGLHPDEEETFDEYEDFSEAVENYNPIRVMQGSFTRYLMSVTPKPDNNGYYYLDGVKIGQNTGSFFYLDRDIARKHNISTIKE